MFYGGELLGKAAASGCGSPPSPAHGTASSASPETNGEAAALLHTSMQPQQQQELLEPVQTYPLWLFLLLQDSQALAPYAGWGLYLGHGVFTESQPPVRNTDQSGKIQQFKR